MRLKLRKNTALLIVVFVLVRGLFNVQNRVASLSIY